jgi:hypothetical protein
MVSKLQRSEHWTLVLEDDRAVASGGADQLFLLDDLDGAGARALHEAFHADRLDLLRGAALERALGDLERLGAVERRRRVPAGPLRCRVDGDAGGLAGLLRTLGPGVVEITEGGEDLTLIVRTSGSHLDRLAGYDALRAPHLYCDLGYHHTVSLGPLVWPGETACLRCLAGRILHAWGDPPAPPRPLAAEHLPLVAALRDPAPGDPGALRGRGVRLDPPGVTR